MIDRREALKKAVLLAGAGFSLPSLPLFKPLYHLGACDWSIGKRMHVETFEVARQIGLQGLQISFNTSENERGLADAATLKSIQQASQRSGIPVSSLAIGELNRVPYKSEPKTEEWVWQSVEAAKALKAPIVLLAFFNNGDLRSDSAGKTMVIERLKKVAPFAEKQGVTLGIESYLSAQEHVEIIEAVGSSAVKVYYDFRNSADAGYDIYKEILFLGKDMICEIHMKENGQRLGEGTLDWTRIAEAIKKIEYSGWMQIEWATPKGVDMVECHRQNRAFLERLFTFS
ncbi:sugar phosphate isomerase/epimerase family protein [Arundinibacter roseus]|uniref:Sugar phosphate isomerase/epimerase n=1 Tax=Arundinibacter roseus TaxID=2070510 RepID=A0A4R4KKA0_9BACT|nr:sugar phosphate isomerase/epimerase family protein [Arundinibacter roseus]TDB67352.1 sugar phosphate isomerase/epimerase [Arundinibacter roseus]